MLEIKGEDKWTYQQDTRHKSNGQTCILKSFAIFLVSPNVIAGTLEGKNG